METYPNNIRPLQYFSDNAPNVGVGIVLAGKPHPYPSGDLAISS
ncbi:MAG: hypothetical protein O9295_13425 [Microcystis sp. LE18-22.4A]|jgi:hypothetical protein|nr:MULTISPECIES: hypothetical protein [Microcystis]MCZ8119020.1 hypothetical protein [Microcystis sp. LE18-22.4A]MDJ0671172.1 hypothetical protein [Microcystis sp. M53598_WE2]